jgi:hypothetical protein
VSDELADPASAAEAKAIQFMQIAVIAAEGIAVLAAARAETRAARAEADTAQLLSSIQRTRGTAERLWQPALDPARRGRLDERQALTAWSAAQPWRDADPAAAEASRASCERLRELNPAAVDAYDALLAKGATSTQAMRSVVPLLTGDASSSTAPATRGSVVHSAADAVATSFPMPLAAAKAQSPTHPDAAGAALARQLSRVTKPHPVRLGR